MSISFHPDDSTLVAYAAGTLDEAFAIVVSCHLESCKSCRSSMKSLEMIGGNALAEVDEVSLDKDAFAKLMDSIDAGKGEEAAPAKLADASDTPQALQEYLGSSLSDVKWKRVSPGVWQNRIELSKGAKSSLRLLRIAPGKKVPEHGHHGQEATLILSGAYEDEIGHFGPGDVADLDVDIEHQPHVVSDVDCICLAATEAPTKFKGLISRLLQPFFGI